MDISLYGAYGTNAFKVKIVVLQLDARYSPITFFPLTYTVPVLYLKHFPARVGRVPRQAYYLTMLCCPLESDLPTLPVRENIKNRQVRSVCQQYHYGKFTLQS